jgi:hypothetical protein
MYTYQGGNAPWALQQNITVDADIPKRFGEWSGLLQNCRPTFWLRVPWSMCRIVRRDVDTAATCVQALLWP